MENPKKQRSTKTKSKLGLFEKLISKRAEKKQQSQHEDKEPRKTWWVQIRLIPIWLRLILIAILIVVAAIIGLQFGYSFIGDGDPKDVLKKETWTHILNIKDGKE